MDLNFIKKSRVKWCASLCLALLMILSSASSQDKKPFKPTLSIKLTEGLGAYSPDNDMNTILESFNNMEDFVIYREYVPGLISGEIKTLSTKFPDCYLEFRLDVNRRIGLGLGISMPFQKSNESTIDWMIVEGQRQVYTIRPKIQILPPLVWSVYYDLFPDSKLSIHLNLGAGLFLAKMSEYYRFEVTPPGSEMDWIIRYWETAFCGTIAPHAGLEIDFKILTTLTFVAEAQWRYAKINNFRGTIYYDGKNPVADREDRGSLYYYNHLEFYTGEWYADLIIPYPESAIEFPRDIRKATLDLSGYSIRLGLKINIF